MRAVSNEGGRTEPIRHMESVKKSGRPCSDTWGERVRGGTSGQAGPERGQSEEKDPGDFNLTKKTQSRAKRYRTSKAGDPPMLWEE